MVLVRLRSSPLFVDFGQTDTSKLKSPARRLCFFFNMIRIIVRVYGAMAVLVDFCTPRFFALLLSTFLISRGAADCPKPPEREHIVLDIKSLLKNDFPKDTQLTFVCSNGYEKHNGSDSIICDGTQWTEPELLCKRKDCGRPKQLPNMIFGFEEGATLFGDAVRITCEVGYRLVGSSYKHCYAKGWIGRAKCDPISCDQPSEISNGQHSWGSTERPPYGAVIQYSCNDGFTLNGTSHVECQGKGVYHSTPPTCEEDESNSTMSTTSSTPLSPVQGGRNTLGSTTSSVFLVAMTEPATPATHGANPILTTREHAISTKARPPVASTPEPLGRGKSGEHVTKVTDKETSHAASSGVHVVAASVISTVLVVLLVLLIFYIYRFKWRRGSYNTQEDLKPGLLQFQCL